MKMTRMKNARRNILTGGFLKLYQLIMPFLMRTVMIVLMGPEYLGLNSLFVSLLQVLNLAELGVGSAMVYSMYEPIVRDDRDTICALLNLYRRLYRVIGLIVAGLGLLLLPILPYLVKSDLPAELDLRLLYLFHLAVTVLSYWLFAYRSSILTAHQRTDVMNVVTLLVSTAQYLLQIFVLWRFRNYYGYLFISLSAQVCINLLNAVRARRLYPEYRPKGELPKEKKIAISQRIRDLFTSRMGGVVVNSADTIVISAFLGLIPLAQYQNYFLIVTSLIGLVSVVLQACLAGVGNSLITDARDKIYDDFQTMTFLIAWIAGVGSVGLLCLLQPFVRMWLGEAYLLDFRVVVCLCAYFYVYEINQMLNMYKDAAGIWHVDRFRTLLTALTNLCLNLLTVRYLGLYGVILSTVVSTLVVGMPWLVKNLFENVFMTKPVWEYVKTLLFDAATAVFACFLAYLACHFLPGEAALGAPGDRWALLPHLALRLLVCMLVGNGVFWLCFHRKSAYQSGIRILKGMLHIHEKQGSSA